MVDFLGVDLFPFYQKQKSSTRETIITSLLFIARCHSGKKKASAPCTRLLGTNTTCTCFERIEKVEWNLERCHEFLINALNGHDKIKCFHIGLERKKSRFVPHSFTVRDCTALNASLNTTTNYYYLYFLFAFLTYRMHATSSDISL